ncbi:hypothetical protein [Streptomyces sp. ML-6]|uniref:hypothetical protein n=1 Tax=Streptomyces sp. ML-6 TaxID=2982693 RepID=UPI0024BF95DC|nr:hypothetical protein [Streptomyces sp. ML-6]MDK0524094.1 hypothetical protein [Streptomyces sp. ML-6]
MRTSSPPWHWSTATAWSAWGYGDSRKSSRPVRQMVADAPMVLFGFLNGHLPARTGEGPSTVPAFDATAYPAMAALSPLMADFGSLTEFDRMPDTVLAGIKDRAAP